MGSACLLCIALLARIWDQSARWSSQVEKASFGCWRRFCGSDGPWPVHTDAALVLYAGGDSATHAATLNIAVGRTNAAVLPPGLAWSMTPTATPGSERSELELLPFVLADEDFVPQIPSSTAVDWLGQLERWTGLLLALGLLIAAIALVIV